MAREQDSVQAERAGRSHIAPLSLVKLTTYTDRVAETGPNVFYFADKACEYDYGNTGTDQIFLPVILGGGDFFSGFKHLPDPEDLTSFGQEFDLRLSNAEINGSRLIELLQAYNLEGAKIEVSQLLLTKAEMDGFAVTKMFDLTGYDGDEHTVLFRGRVNRVAPITDSFLTIQCVPDLPSDMGPWERWTYVSDADSAAPLDTGKRLPRLYGSSSRTPVIAWLVGFSSSMAEPIAIEDNNVNKLVTSAAGLPTSPTTFVLRVDNEQILCTKVDATTINIEQGGRGYNGTSAVAHDWGVGFLEIIDNPKWVISDFGSEAVNDIFAEDPSTGELTRLDTDVIGLTIDEHDTDTTVPGRIVTSVIVDQMTAFVEFANSNEATGAGQDDYEEFADGEYGATDSGYHELTSGDGSYTFLKDWVADDADHDTKGIGYTVCTFSIWLTQTGGDVDDVICKINGSSGTTIGTIEAADIPAAGSLPQRFRFQFDPTDVTSDSEIVINYDPEGTGAIRIFHGELSYNRDDRSVDQTAASITGTIDGASQADMDKAIDGDEDTSVAFTTTASERLVVTWAQPTGISSFDSFTVHLLMDPNAHGASTYFGFRDDDGSSEPFLTESTRTNVAPSTKRWYHYHVLPGASNRNSIILQSFSDGAITVGDIYEITRTVHKTRPWHSAPSGQLYASIDGIEAPNGDDYQVSVGLMIEHPADILRHWIEAVGGETIDEASYDALVTSLGASAAWAFDVRSLGFTWEEVLQRMAFEARCNVVAVETAAGRVWKLLSADSGYGFGEPPSSSIITQTHGLSDVGRSVDDIANYLTFRYAFDASQPGGGNEESFRLVLRATPDDSDVPITTTLIGNSEARFGSKASGPIAFRCIQDPATAQDVAGYIVQERMANDRRVYELREVAWFDALPYDVGDIVSITAPWSSSATTCRITSMSKAFTSNAWTITAVEVLETGLRTP
jgi:hypothetical protein